MTRGCDHFEGIDDALRDRVRCIAIALVMNNETLGNKIDKSHMGGEQRKVGKESVRVRKEKNKRLSCS